MTNESPIDKINRLITQSKTLKTENETLMRENITLKAQNEVKDAEIARLNEKLIERENELTAIGRQIDELLG